MMFDETEKLELKSFFKNILFEAREQEDYSFSKKTIGKITINKYAPFSYAFLKQGILINDGFYPTVVFKDEETQNNEIWATLGASCAPKQGKKYSRKKAYAKDLLPKYEKIRLEKAWLLIQGLNKYTPDDQIDDYIHLLVNWLEKWLNYDILELNQEYEKNV